MAWMDEGSPDWCEIYRGVKGPVEGKVLIYPGTNSCMSSSKAEKLAAKLKPFLDLIEPANDRASLADVWDRWEFTKQEWLDLLEGVGEIYDPDQPLE